MNKPYCSQTKHEAFVEGSAASLWNCPQAGFPTLFQRVGKSLWDFPEVFVFSEFGKIEFRCSFSIKTEMVVGFQTINFTPVLVANVAALIKNFFESSDRLTTAVLRDIFAQCKGKRYCLATGTTRPRTTFESWLAEKKAKLTKVDIEKLRKENAGPASWYIAWRSMMCVEYKAICPLTSEKQATSGHPKTYIILVKDTFVENATNMINRTFGQKGNITRDDITVIFEECKGRKKVIDWDNPATKKPSMTRPSTLDLWLESQRILLSSHKIKELKDAHGELDWYNEWRKIATREYLARCREDSDFASSIPFSSVSLPAIEPDHDDLHTLVDFTELYKICDLHPLSECTRACTDINRVVLCAPRIYTLN
jgi:hypothetical protein